jgi:hypothetical protein
VDNDLVGGTAQTVRFELEGIPEPYAPPRSPLDPVEAGPVYHIVTPRAGHPAPADPPLTVHKRYPAGYDSVTAAAAAYARVHGRMNMLNRDWRRLASRLDHQRIISKGCVLPEKEAEALPAPLRALLDAYGIADALAIRFRRWTMGMLVALLGFVFLAAFFYSATDVLLERPWGRGLYVGSLALAYLVYLGARWGGYEVRYQDYRALAEGLRVQFFWRMAGLPDSAADHYLRMQRSELDWIRNAIRVWAMPTTPEPGDRLHLVLTHWVKDQHAYFTRATRRDQRALRQLEYLGKGAFLIGFVWAGGKALVGLLPARVGTPSLFPGVGLGSAAADLLHAGTVLLGLMPVLAALIYGYTKTRALPEHTKQYNRMGQLFALADQRLEKLLAAGNRPAARALILELGKEALAENGDWLHLHRERPMQLPRA